MDVGIELLTIKLIGQIILLTTSRVDGNFTANMLRARYNPKKESAEASTVTTNAKIC